MLYVIEHAIWITYFKIISSFVWQSKECLVLSSYGQSVYKLVQLVVDVLLLGYHPHSHSMYLMKLFESLMTFNSFIPREDNFLKDVVVHFCVATIKEFWLLSLLCVVLLYTLALLSLLLLFWISNTSYSTS